MNLRSAITMQNMQLSMRVYVAIKWVAMPESKVTVETIRQLNLCNFLVGSFCPQ